MGRYERASKNSIKAAQSLVSSIVDTVKTDLRSQESRLDEEMRNRVESIQKTLFEVASVQDAIIAGSLNVKKSLSKAQKKLVKSGERSAMKEEILDAAKRLGELRKLHDEAAERIQVTLASNLSAVDIIERMMKDLFKMGGSWESDARGIDEVIGEAVDPNPPVEMIELERELNSSGFDVILAGDDRNVENIEANRVIIREMSRNIDDSEDQ